MIDVAAAVEFAPSYHPAAARAEVQALFFLAGWREHAAPGFTPWLVCIDAPPPSVCWLAEQTGARLVHAPFRGRTESFNRARAWDPFPGEHARRLVLDPEVLVIKPPSSALATLAGAPAARPPLPEDVWPAIYRAVGVPMPTERLRTLRAELGLPVGKRGDTMPPYYHPAALLAPSRVGLGELWARHGALLAARRGLLWKDYPPNSAPAWKPPNAWRWRRRCRHCARGPAASRCRARGTGGRCAWKQACRWAKSRCYTFPGCSVN